MKRKKKVVRWGVVWIGKVGGVSPHSLQTTETFATRKECAHDRALYDLSHTRNTSICRIEYTV